MRKPTVESDDDADYGRRRRAWILANHPDRGGDPDQFVAGLAQFAASYSTEQPTVQAADDRPTVYRSRSPWRRARRIVRTIRRRTTQQSRTRKLL